MADHDGQDRVTPDQSEEAMQLRNELQLANVMLADLSTQLANTQVKLARANALNQITKPTA